MISSSSDAKAHSIYLAIGWLLVILGLCFLLPTSIAVLRKEKIFYFLYPCLFSGGAGLGLIKLFKTASFYWINTVYSLILTVSIWIVSAIVCALPFYLSDISPSVTDALFESVSCLTTTGYSLLSNDLFFSSESLLFWKIFLQWIGGIGIVFIAVSILPALKIGGNHLISTEFSDRSEKSSPKTSSIVVTVMSLYVCWSIASATLLLLGGLCFKDALYYSMASISTGGIIVSQTPVLSLSMYCKIILTMNMILGGSTLIFLPLLIKGNFKSWIQDDQIRGYLKALIISSALFMAWKKTSLPFLDSIFIAVSASSTTGFFAGIPKDGFMTSLLLIASYIGGCSGSTAGGLKIFRIQIFYRITRNYILGMLNPYGVFPTFYNQSSVDEKIILSVISIVFMYMLGLFCMTLGISCLGYSFGKSFSFAAGTLSNSGLCFEGMCQFLSSMKNEGKWMGIVGMLCGRFEFMTLIGVFMIPWWRR
jgi:trk system potassium uptake protein TrkH